MMPKILVGCPTSEHKVYCLKEYIQGLKNLTYTDFDIIIVDNSESENYYDELKKEFKDFKNCEIIHDKWFENARERIVHSRNLIREKVLSKNYDCFFSLEQDVIPPKDIIEKLLKHNENIIAGLYFKLGKDKKTLLPLVMLEVKNYKNDGLTYGTRATLEQVEQNKTLEVLCPGLGCILIKKEVLEKVKFRWEKDKAGFDDVFFCDDARKQGFKVFCDTSIKCKHLVIGMDWSKIKK